MRQIDGWLSIEGADYLANLGHVRPKNYKVVKASRCSTIHWLLMEGYATFEPNSSPLSQGLSDGYSDGYSDLDEDGTDEIDDYQTFIDEISDDETSDYSREEEDDSSDGENHIEDTSQSHSKLVKNILSSSTKGRNIEIADDLIRRDKASDLEIPAKSYTVTQKVDLAVGEAVENQSLIPQSKLVKHITISWDQTREGDFKTEILQAVLGRPSTSIPEVEPPKKTGNHALQDYQMQLMLLEQQNKKRLLLARSEQERSKLDIGSVTTQIFAKQERELYPVSLSSETNPQRFQDPFRCSMMSMGPNQLSSQSPESAITMPERNAGSVVLSQSVNSEKIPQSAEIIESLRGRIAKLEAENAALNTELGSLDEATEVPLFYRIQSDRMTYIGQPQWSLDSKKNVVLQGTNSIGNLESYLKYNNHSPFVVVRTYRSVPHIGSRTQKNNALSTLPAPQQIAESIIFVSDDMKDAMKSFLDSQINLPEGFVSAEMNTGVIEAPYLFWYHMRSVADWHDLSPPHEKLMRSLTAWIDQHYEDEYTQADSLFHRGLVSFPTFKYLIKPGDVLLSRLNKDTQQAHMAVTWPLYESYTTPPARQERQMQHNTNSRSWRWTIKTWNYDFVGQFYRNNTSEALELLVTNLEDEVRMADLNFFPLKFAPKSVRDKLDARGRRFWSCRNRQLVSYEGKLNGGLMATSDRYMIDFATYAELEKGSAVVRRIQYYEKERKPAFADKEDVPLVPHTYLFPPQIIGYNLRQKRWVDLDVGSISDVTWNKKAFDQLVIDEETKELVLALITNKLAADDGADFIESKGQGLIMLLHGGPGTGKTFTAESVAEIAEKPLFRVTCGDIGTQPEAVEKYLESVLHLAKIWDCVVLLDEADVFLEQRTLNELGRNALVSIFLRVLEYFEGILILTSNRVGTFDEAFKSRIQLSLHYKNLTKSQRLKIWKNFFRQLRNIPGIKIDFDDIDCYVDELAQNEMNGRQIRNAITTARQLAQFKNSPMTITHLKHVIRVAGKFDEYLKTVQEGFSDDQLARGDGLR